MWEDWEGLVKTMADLDRRRGVPLDDAMRGHALTVSITDLIELLRLEQEAKAGVIPTWPPTQAAEEAQA